MRRTKFGPEVRNAVRTLSAKRLLSSRQIQKELKKTGIQIGRTTISEILKEEPLQAGAEVADESREKMSMSLIPHSDSDHGGSPDSPPASSEAPPVPVDSSASGPSNSTSAAPAVKDLGVSRKGNGDFKMGRVEWYNPTDPDEELILPPGVVIHHGGGGGRLPLPNKERKRKHKRNKEKKVRSSESGNKKAKIRADPAPEPEVQIPNSSPSPTIENDHETMQKQTAETTPKMNEDKITSASPSSPPGSAAGSSSVVLTRRAQPLSLRTPDGDGLSEKNAAAGATAKEKKAKPKLRRPRLASFASSTPVPPVKTAKDQTSKSTRARRRPAPANRASVKWISVWKQAKVGSVPRSP